ncbi:MAG: putative Carboxylesterase [Polyangiaceae bacterium]|nr:putative Carboxylesterase [Polyangiaceae bacterium]
MLVLCHGYGAPGDDLVPLGQELGPSVRFACPAAPGVLQMGVPPEYSGRYWWPIDMVELQTAVMLGNLDLLMARQPEGLAESRGALLDLLDVLEREHAAPRERLVLGGFSQGAMLATDVTLHAERPPAALAILSGSLIARDEWLPLMPRRAGLRVLQSHGRADPVLAYAIAEKLRDGLGDAGLSVRFVPFNGGHGIPPVVVNELAELLQSVRA